MYLFNIILICLLICSESHKIDQITGNFIIDVTTSMYAKSSFTAFFCIDTNDAVRFSRQMSRSQMMHQTINNFEELDFTQIRSKVSSQSFFVLDLDCPSAPEFLLKVNASRLFIAPSKWLLLQDLRKAGNSTAVRGGNSPTGINDEGLTKLFGELEIYPDSEVLIGQRLENNFIDILSLYRPSPYRSLILEDRGFWNNVEGLSICDRSPTSRRRQDLQGTPLKSCLVMTDPETLNHLTDYKDKHIDAVTKANYIWVLHLVDRMNATVNFTWRNTWGYQEKNETWSGMIGLLDRGEIDLGGTATFLISSRIGVVDYVQLYTPVGSRFVFRRPPLSYISNLFTLPFSRFVWMAIAVFLTIVSGLLYISMKWEWKQIKEKPSEVSLTGQLVTNPTISDNLLIILSAVSQQGSSYIPQTISSRIIIIMLLITALSLYASYTANIVALIQATATSINTIKDLMDSGLKVGTYDIVYNRYYFKAFEDPVRKEFNQRLMENRSSAWLSLEEGVHKVRMGLYAFHMDTGAGYYLIQKTFAEDEKCGLHEIDYLNVLNPMLVIKHQSPYREMIRVGALRIHETGLKGRDVPRLFTEKPICAGRTNFVTVGTTECYAAFLTIVYGMAISIGIFFLEILWHKYCERQETDNDLDNVMLDEDTVSLELTSVE